ncbi:MAG TPA: pyridoxamine 5'-phosphate oxidase family protein [Anaeromyxobacteraceae bacterium]|nr:pyridoxamine 5'-phosphate oxidase family protein [Anaeromyxobacteraceae bacterium]
MTGLRTVRRSFSDPRVRRSIRRILRGTELCSVATVSPGKRAHVSAAYFAYSPDLELYFLSDPASRHCRNLERNASMAVAVFRSDQVWGRADRGMQLFGTCREVWGRQARLAERVYAKRFPGYVRTLRGTSPGDRRIAAQLRGYGRYRFVPRWVKILDEREFGDGVLVVATVPRARPKR